MPHVPARRRSLRRVTAIALAALVAAACASGPDPVDDSVPGSAPATPATGAPTTGAPAATPSASPATPSPARGTVTPVAVRRLRAEPYSFTYNSGFRDSARIIARDSITWARVWDKLHERSSPQPLPRVSFADSMVVVVALGQRSTGGYSIMVDSAARVRDTLANTVRRTSPGPRCGTTAALSEPVDIAVLPRVTGPVRWVERAEVTRCP